VLSAIQLLASLSRPFSRPAWARQSIGVGPWTLGGGCAELVVVGAGVVVEGETLVVVGVVEGLAGVVVFGFAGVVLVLVLGVRRTFLVVGLAALVDVRVDALGPPPTAPAAVVGRVEVAVRDGSRAEVTVLVVGLTARADAVAGGSLTEVEGRVPPLPSRLDDFAERGG
jgi:hypothetical protein